MRVDRALGRRRDRVAVERGDDHPGGLVDSSARRHARSARVAVARRGSRPTRPTRLRCWSGRGAGCWRVSIAGVACIGAGLGAFFVSVDSWQALSGGLIGAAVVLVGFALILGPGRVGSRAPTHGRTARAHPLRRARRGRRAPARLGAADARARATARRRPARGRPPRPHAGARAAQLAAHRRRQQRRDRRLARRRARRARRRSRDRARRAGRSRACPRLPGDRNAAAAARGARGDGERGSALGRGERLRLPRGGAATGVDLRA